SLPGTPVLRYGQEIGMGDDLSLEERSSVRTVMQWSDKQNAGFSAGDPEKLARPAIKDGDFGYKKVNVKEQHRNNDSLLNWFEKIISFRKEYPEFGWGTCNVLETNHPAVLAHACSQEAGM